ncbi:MAG: DUF58 domain-containing protein [Deltaproteobacteria bacterium]|nr:DUF58 domain-containing protein [Deltaproteobacteria bacterium]
MSFRLTISAPMPWLVSIAGAFLGKKSARVAAMAYILPRTLRFTKEGRNFTIALILIGLAAINTGNNLLYLITAALMSLIIVSGLLSESTLRRLTVEREMPKHIYKDTEAPAALHVGNGKKKLASFSFTVNEMQSAGISSAAQYVLKLQPFAKLTLYTPFVFKKRGYAELTGFELSTRFPFGLFRKGRAIVSPGRVLVYPSVNVNVSDDIRIFSESGTSGVSRKGRGFEIYGLRDYAVGDDSRHIHWKASARALKLMTREYEKEAEKKALITFNNFRDSNDAFESAVDRAASSAYRMIRLGYRVSLKTLTFETPYGFGTEHLHTILSKLALIEPVATKGAATVAISGAGN